MMVFEYCWTGLFWFAAIWPTLSGVQMAVHGNVIDAGFMWTFSLFLIFAGALPLMLK